jgi:hypothetical protein
MLLMLRIIVTTLIGLAISAHAEVNPTGTWKIEIELPNGQTYYPEATIREKGGGLEGAYYSQTADQTSPLEDVRLESGSQLHFTFNNNAGIMLKYVGGIDGNQMDGMAFVDFRGQKFKSEFSATREVKVSSLAGTWNTEMKRDGNTTTNTFKLSVGEDGEISGTFGKDATKEIEAVKLEDGVLTFSIKRQYSGNDFVMNYRGQIEGDEIRGEVIIKAGGVERRKYPWKAKKVN